MNLNKNQKLAVESSDKHLCVLAGPGTGKTLTITAKIIHLLKKGLKPNEIAALTFTQKAALEMRERVIKHLERKEDLPFIGTFHLLCIRLLREFLPEEEKNFQICTRTKQKEIIHSLGEKNAAKIIEKISKFKNRGLSLDDKTYSIYENYEARKKELNLLDFDDLLIKTLEMLRQGEIPQFFNHIIVDEFQDINKIQYEIIKMLLGERSSLSVFGDPDQAIYSFRGSEIDLFLNLPMDFQNLTLLNLSLNYRSQANIITVSNKFITGNTKRFSKKIEPTKTSTTPVVLIEVGDEYEETKIILREIKKRLGATDFTELYSNKEETHYSYSSFAVLARTNRQLNIIKEQLMNEGIPTKTVKKDADTWIDRFIRNFSSLLSNQTISEKLGKSIPLNEFLELSGIFESLHEYESQIIRNISSSYKRGTLIEQIQAFLDEIHGMTSFDLFPESLNAVSLLTLHSAKGLEFPVVFITGVEEGLIPYTLSSEWDIEEERRLFYVGMTRAMDELILLHARSRFINGKRVSLPLSSFLREIPEEYLEIRKIRPKKDGFSQKNLF